jgi:hypothetical protein
MFTDSVNFDRDVTTAVQRGRHPWCSKCGQWLGAGGRWRRTTGATCSNIWGDSRCFWDCMTIPDTIPSWWSLHAMTDSVGEGLALRRTKKRRLLFTLLQELASPDVYACFIFCMLLILPKLLCFLFLKAKVHNKSLCLWDTAKTSAQM